MITDGYRLGIDFGTSNTVAVVHEPAGRSRPLLFDGYPQLPSSVCATPEGLLVGREAVHTARVRPECFEPHPKRRIDDGTVLLGEEEHPVEGLIAAVVGQVRAEALRTMGAAPASVVVTHPAAWAARRRSVLASAVKQAGFETFRLVPEPVAAAAYFARSTTLAEGSCVVVYDFGAGTFDASVVRRVADGWELAASDGLPDAGGLDVDAAIVGYLGAVYSASYPDQMRRLDTPVTAADRRAFRNLWEDVRTAKEILSRASSAMVHLPIVEQDAPLGREQVERLAGPVVERTVALTRAVIGAAVPAGRLAGLFLVGGSSRMPLVTTLLHRGTGVAPTVLEQPELAVAQGAVVPLDGAVRAVRQRAPVRVQVAVPGAAPVSEETAQLVAQPLVAQPLVAQPLDAQSLVENGATVNPGVAEKAEVGESPIPGRTRGTGGKRSPGENGMRGSGGKPKAVRKPSVGETAGRAGGGRALAVAAALLAALIVMAATGRWDFWLGDALLFPGFLLCLAFAAAGPGGLAPGPAVSANAVSATVVPGNAAPGSANAGSANAAPESGGSGSGRSGSGGGGRRRGWLWRLAVYAVALGPAAAGACWVGQRFGLVPWHGTAAVAVLAGALILRRRVEPRVVAEFVGVLLALTAFAAVHPAVGRLTLVGLAMGVAVAVAFVGLAGALGRYVASAAPDARRWLPRIAAVLLAVGAALQVALG